MALLTAGYWPTTYWPENYWDDDYWPGYSTATEIETNRNKIVIWYLLEEARTWL